MGSLPTETLVLESSVPQQKRTVQAGRGVVIDSRCRRGKTARDVKQIVENGAFKRFDMQPSAVVSDDNLFLQDGNHATPPPERLMSRLFRITMMPMDPPSGGRVP